MLLYSLIINCIEGYCLNIDDIRYISDIILYSGRTHADIAMLKDKYGDELPSLKRLCAEMDSNLIDYDLSSSIEVVKEMRAFTEKNYGKSSVEYRNLRAAESQYENLKFNNKDAELIQIEIAGLAEKYEKDSLSRIVFDIQNRFDPYQKYDILAGFETSNDEAQKLNNFIKRSNIPETLDGYDILISTIQMFARTGNYLDDADHIYGRACKIYKKVKGKDRIPFSDEFYYQCYKYLLSRSQGSSLVPDFDAYRRASQITDSIDIFPMKISSVSFLMNISLVNNELISAREWARKALILADDAAKNEKEGTFNIAEIEGRLSYIYYRLMADGETAALRDINDLIERYRTRNAPPEVMLYIFNYVLNFNSDTINKDIKPLCIEYLSSKRDK